MTKTAILALITKLTVSFKALFPTKTQVTSDIDAAKAEAKSYTDTAVSDATNGAADTTYVDNQIATVNSTISTFQAGLDDKIDTRVASLGTFIGTSDTYAGLPTTDQNGKAYTAGDFAHLTATDGSYAKGLYRYDGTEYVFISGDPAIVEIFSSLKYTSIDDTDDTKFVTGKYIKDREDQNAVTQTEVDNAVGV